MSMLPINLTQTMCCSEQFSEKTVAVYISPSTTFIAWIHCLNLVVFMAAYANGNTCTVSNPSSWEAIIECPNFNVNLTYEDDNYLEVICPNMPNFELLRDLPDLPSFTVNELVYQNCPLPVNNQSLVELLSAFVNRSNQSYINKLFLIDNAKLSEDITLDPQLFAGLFKLQFLSIQNLADISFDNSLLFRHLSQLKKIEFHSRNRVSGTILQQLKQLKELHMHDSDMKKLPKELVSNLPKLETLYLDKNKLKHVSQFTTLPNLMYLNISSNQLVKLQQNVFSRLPKLKILDLSSNKLTRLVTDLFMENNHLEVFKADDQKCSELVLEKHVFTELKYLKEVSLSNCKITALPEGIFQHCLQLIKVDLSHNKLQSLPEDLLSDSFAVELYLQHNEFINMHPESQLLGANDVCFLDLSHNKITTLSIQLLKSFSSLKQLQLHNNQLYMIDVDAFKSQSQSLIFLNLSHNRLTLHENNDRMINSTSWILFRPLIKLAHLDLSYNEITNIFDHFKNFMHNLQSLDLSHNFITHISYTDFPFLSSKINLVNLESNKITHPDFDLRSIEPLHRLPNEIFLADNPLNCDCISSSLVTYLQAHLNASKSTPLKGLQCTHPLALFGRKPQTLRAEDLLCEKETLFGFCPIECKCYKRPVDQAAIINCTAVNLTRVPVIKSPSIIKCSFIELHLEQNKLNALSNGSEGWNTVRRLYISNNNFTTLPGDSLPVQLELLDVSGNQLTEVDAAFILKLNHTALRNISLSANPWDCHCENPLLAFAVDNAARITDFSTLQCSDGQPINSATLNKLCAWTTTLSFYISSAVSLLLIVCLLAIWLYMKYSLEIKVWLFKHNLLQWLVTEEQIDMDKRYDAFISYSHKDEEFVTDKLLPRLESEELNFKICWHVRDFMPGEMITSQIAKAVEDSRRTIIILSHNYLESVWGQMEFNTAYLQSLEDKRNRVIPIIYQDIDDIDQLDPKLQAYIKTNTYVRWDDPWFWDKLHYAMPRKCCPKHDQATGNITMLSLNKQPAYPYRL
ncbi:protein toll-like isoform X1 [Anopheles arabiensis]|nr:protein toll-like isoform X1 [Anopheles arabiensis]